MRSCSTRLMEAMLISLYVLSVFSTSLVSSDALIIQPALLNFTTNLTIPPPLPLDPRLKIRSSYKLDVPLNPKSVLAIVTNEMAKLAIMDFNGRVGSFQSTPWAGYSDTKIQFKVSAPAEQVETQIAVWSLYLLATNIGLQNRYNQVLFNILWDNVQVATLRIYPTTSSQVTIERRSGPHQNITEDLPYLQYPSDMFGTSQNNESSSSVNSTSLTTANLALEFFYPPQAVELSVTEVLGGIMAGLKSVAPVAKTDRMDGIFTTNVEGIDSKVYFAGDFATMDQPRYQYQYVIGALRAMPEWLLSQGRLAEMTCGLLVYNRRVGLGFLGKLDRPI